MVVWRRTLFCKMGKAGAVAALQKEMARISREADPSVRAVRVYTDLSGVTERVVTEIERESMLHPREASRRVHGNPDAMRIIQELGPLVERAETEFLSLELSE
jgi:hypothetical protein